MNKEELEERLSALEAAYAKKAEQKPDPEAEARKIEAEDEHNVMDMLILAGDDEEAKKEVYRRAQLAKLGPEQTKKVFQENRRDEEWVSGMLKKGGKNA